MGVKKQYNHPKTNKNDTHLIIPFIIIIYLMNNPAIA